MKILHDRETGKSRGFGFVTFEHEDEAKACVVAIHGTVSEVIYFGQIMVIVCILFCVFMD